MPDRPAPPRLTKRNHPHAIAAREHKAAKAAERGIDADYVSAFVDAFYAKIRGDALLGPIFAARISDWDPHLARMKRFWRSILLGSGEYAGNPMEMHMTIPGLDERHFAHWLDLFYATLRELEPHPQATLETGKRARMIADSLLTGIATREHGLTGARAGQNLPHP